VCPYCKKDGYGHCYVEIHGAGDEEQKRDGLHQCHKCGEGGNLYTLKEHLGVNIPGVQSRAEWAGKTAEPLPDIDAAHQLLLEDSDALDYLINTRGFSREIIEKQKLGIVEKKYFKECGEVKALVYPYFVNNNCVFVHFRTLPPSPKSFTSPKGWDVPLYNGEILRDGLKELVLVEGEANVIAALDKGYTNVCGVPGANVKKAEWIDTIDKLELEKIYICYDNDKVGQKAAQSLASRIGIEKCWKIQLPNFTFTNEEGEEKKGKDLNEWFVHTGATADSFRELLKDAKLFDVDGVTAPTDALQELEDLINGRGLTPKYTTPWPSLNKLVGFDPGDVIDIIAPAKIGKTTFSMNLLEHMCDTYGEDGVIICLEMTTVKLARKWVAHVAGIEDNIPKTPEEAEALKQAFLEGIQIARHKSGNRDGDLYFCYPHYKKMDDLYKLIIDIIRRYGVKWIVFDNVQRACDTTVGSKNRTYHLSEISKVLSQIAKDYEVQVVRIIQPHQIKAGQLTQAEDADGSSQISKDCDATITLDRIRLNKLNENDFEQLGFVESEASFSPKMLASVGLSRYSGGGYTTLRYDGARSTVT